MSRSRRHQPRPPKLTPETVQDDVKLGSAIDKFIKDSPVMKAHSRRVRKRQENARLAVEDDHWQAVLALDDAHVDRVADLAVLLVRWAFEQCRRVTDDAGKKPSR